MTEKIITILELEGLPAGSVIQDCEERIDEKGVKCWYGLWCSMAGSYYVMVEQEHCEIWNEEKHDDMWAMRQWLESDEGKEWNRTHPLPR